MKAGVLAEPVLVGRERELEELMRCLDSAFDGKGTTVFVSGEAGSGKTRLVNEFLGVLKGKEVAVLSSWCISDVAVPYFPFMEAFDAYYSSRNRDSEPIEDEEAAIKAWLVGPKQAAKSEQLQNLTPQAWQDLAVAAATKALISISAKKTVILFIDDLHWADSASLSLLHYISRSITSARVLVMATYRSEELHPDAEGRPHPLLETLRLMRRGDLIKEIKLPNLDQANVAALAEKMVGGSLHPELADRLAVDSQGNPLFVVESLRMLSERGSLVQDSGRWRLSIGEVGIPTKIRDIILRRVGRLKPNQRRILDLASVMGEKFDVELLGAVLGQDSLEVLETLNAIEQSSSLVFCEGNYYEFDHAKSRDAVYEEIPTLLRRGFHARIAEKMEAKSKDAKDLPVNDLAYHFAQAGNKDKAVEYALAAGEDALARFSNPEAMKHYAYVLGTVSEAAECAGERIKALEGLGDALSSNGLFVEATKTFEQLSSAAESGAVKLRALRKAVLCCYWSSDWAHALELGTKAEEYAHFDRLEHARLRVYRGFVERGLERAKEAFEDVEGALRVFEEEYSLRDVASALVESVFLYVDVDQVGDGAAAGLRSLALYEELEDLRGQMLAHNRLAMVSPSFFQSAQHGDEATRIAEKVGDYNIVALDFHDRATTYDWAGDLRGAVALFLKGAEYAERTEAYFALIHCYMGLVRVYAKLGETEQAEEFAKKIDKLFDKVGSLKSNMSLVNLVQWNKAFLFSAKDQWKEANDILERFKPQNLYGSNVIASYKFGYAWVLAKQGRNEEAKMQLDAANRMRQKRAERLKGLEHASVQAYLMAQREIGVGEELNIRLDLVNVAKRPAALIRVEALVPPEFKATNLPSYCSVQNGSIEFNRKELGSFTAEPLKLSLQATKAGAFTLNPRVVYVDDTGETKTFKSRPVTVTVRPTLHAKIGEETISVPILPGRVATGFAELDALLYGGIPENYAVILTSPPTDEREQLIRRFLEAGTTAHASTVYITTEPGSAKALAKDYPSDFFLFVCNPRADAIIEGLPNIFKFKGVENLTEIDIALTKVFRTLDPAKPGPKRVCIDVVSDVLLQHHAVTTRKWLSGLIQDLKSKGFTVLAVVNPQMHSSEEAQAILSLFDGEIEIAEKAAEKGLERTLRIRKLVNQRYLEDELSLSIEK